MNALPANMARDGYTARSMAVLRLRSAGRVRRALLASPDVSNRAECIEGIRADIREAHTYASIARVDSYDNE